MPRALGLRPWLPRDDSSNKEVRFGVRSMRQVLILFFLKKKIYAVREAEGGRRGGREKKRELARETAREMLYRTRNTVQLLAPTQGSWWSSARVCFLVVVPCSLDIFYADVRSEIISINLFLLFKVQIRTQQPTRTTATCSARRSHRVAKASGQLATQRRRQSSAPCVRRTPTVT